MAQDGAMSSNSANTSYVDAESNAKSLTSKELYSRSIRRVYLITYTKPTWLNFPRGVHLLTRSSFHFLVFLHPFNSGVVAKKNTSHLVESTITWPSNLTEINGGFQVRDTCRSTMLYRSTFLLSMITITVLGNIQQNRTKMRSRAKVILTFQILQTVQKLPRQPRSVD